MFQNKIFLMKWLVIADIVKNVLNTNSGLQLKIKCSEKIFGTLILLLMNANLLSAIQKNGLIYNLYLIKDFFKIEFS